MDYWNGLLEWITGMDKTVWIIRLTVIGRLLKASEGIFTLHWRLSLALSVILRMAFSTGTYVDLH
jgi:hypothetical protein